MAGLIQKLINIQSSLNAPKNQYNSFGKYHYRSCEDIMAALKPLLKQEGVLQYITDEVVLIGNRFYVK
ncbi:ERF family protein, partial [Salmonella enterica]